MTLILVGITCIISIIAFNKRELIYKFQFNAYQIIRRRQFARLIVHGFLHANWTHLLINMIVLFSFGRNLEEHFAHVFGPSSDLLFLLLYVSAIVIAPVYSLIKQRNNYLYNAIGASGAVSAILFAEIIFNPWSKIYFFGILPIPGILFAVLYLVYSWQMSKRPGDNIAHDTHFLGAVYGLVFPFLFNPQLFPYFIEQLVSILPK